MHALVGRYAGGDRAYAVAEFESDAVHQSVRLGSARLDVPAAWRWLARAAEPPAAVVGGRP